MQQIITSAFTYGCDADIVFYNMVGNFIPPEWRGLQAISSQHISKTSIQLLSLIVDYLHSSTDTPNELQESYFFFETKLGVCQRRVKQCLTELQDNGFISYSLATVIKHNIKCRNTLCIKLARNFKRVEKKISGEGERNFRSSGNNFPPHYIIDNNIYKSKSRYSKSDFEKNNFEGSEEQPTEDSISESWLKKAADKAKSWCKGKKLAEFHPLTEEEGKILQIRSGREFNLNFINKLLLKLSEQYPDHSFYSRKSVLNYMAKALAFELRETCRVNNENFRFKTDDNTTAQEQYLQNIEYSSDTDTIAQLKRKVAAVFNREVAYQLLTCCRFSEPDSDCYRLKLLGNITISEHSKAILLEQIQAVYGNGINKLEILPHAQASYRKQDANIASSETYNTLDCLNQESIWFKARKSLMEWYGINIDKAWFSKLESIEEDASCRRVTLKAPTAFIGDWLKSNYESALTQAFQNQGFTFEIVRI